MIKIDNDFLEKVGLAGMAEDKKPEFLRQTQEELEKRVGEKMSEGMTVEQLKEFDGIMNNDRDTMVGMLSKLGDYRNDSIYQKLLQRHNVSQGNLEILGEYLSVKWIQINRPDYAEVTSKVLNELGDEISANASQILANN